MAERAISRRATLLLLACALLGMLYGVSRLALRTASGLSVVNYLLPGLVPSSRLATNLECNDPELVYTSLSILALRADPVATHRAEELLSSKDPYVWLNAARYLAACGQQEAVPYLIKSLRHKAWKSYPESATNLTK